MMVSQKRILDLIWLVLVIATLGSYGVVGVNFAGGFGFAFIILIGVIKAFLITHYFMEVDVAPKVWKVIFSALIITAGLVIILLHFAA